MNEALTDADYIKAVLDKARRGGATLAELGRAHDLALKWNLSESLAEVRAHIANLVPMPRSSPRFILSLTLGVVSGFITHYALKEIGER